jgi:hypothetical protein
MLRPRVCFCVFFALYRLRLAMGHYSCPRSYQMADDSNLLTIRFVDMISGIYKLTDLLIF